ncbi:UNVERIFIED_CONTAM: hypothetical protein NCL1_20956 [Trichonephila clavipes]
MPPQNKNSTPTKLIEFSYVRRMAASPRLSPDENLTRITVGTKPRFISEKYMGPTFDLPKIQSWLHSIVSEWRKGMQNKHITLIRIFDIWMFLCKRTVILEAQEKRSLQLYKYIKLFARF